MEDLSLHILDIAENSVNAGATVVEIGITEDSASGRLSLTVKDNGSGMDAKALMKAEDAFYTSKAQKRFGLGLPLLKQAALESQGDFHIKSAPGEGTSVQAEFRTGHIDIKPLGDIGSTMLALICGHPEIRYLFTYESDGFSYLLDTGQLKDALGDVPVNIPEVLLLLKEEINQAIQKKQTNPLSQGGFTQ